jgi:hypothetical protein
MVKTRYVALLVGLCFISALSHAACTEQTVGSKQTFTFTLTSPKPFTNLVLSCSRTLYDNGVYTATCPTNISVQPTVDNIPERSCTTPCNDMTVEACGSQDAGDGSFRAACTVHNSEGTNDKHMKFCGATRE